MSSPKDVPGPIIVWEDYGCEGWQPRSFASLIDAITAGAVTHGSMVTTRLDMAKYVTEPTIDDAPTTPRKPVPLTRDQCRLLATASAVESFRYRDACDLLGGEPWHILNTLRLVGAIEHPAYDRWVITEKGRIAVALAMAKDPELSNLLGTVPCHDDGTGTPAAASGTVTGHSDSGGQGWHGGRK